MKKIEELKKVNEIMMLTQSRYGDNIVRTLDEVCEIVYGTRITKNNNVEGEYPVYGSGRATFSTNTFNRNGYNILVGRFALSSECVRFTNEKIFLNDSGLSIKPKTDIILDKYIGYYLYHNQCIIYKCARGTAQKNLEINEFKSIKIPIPSIEQQAQIAEYLDNNTKLIEQLEKEIARCKLLSNKIMSSLVSKDEQLDNNKPEITQETKTSKKIYKLDKDNLCDSTEIDEHNISNSDLDSDTSRIKKKKIVKKEYNSDNDETKHIVSEKPNIKNKKIVKKEYISDNDEQETKHIVSEKPNIKKEYISDNDNQHTKTKKYYMADDTTDSIEPHIKKIIKKEYVETVEDDNIEMQYKKKIENRKTKNVKRNT